jgi:hypothetical protein
MRVRRFSADLKTKVPGGNPGLYVVPIRLDRSQLPDQDMRKLAQRLNGLPILLVISANGDPESARNVGNQHQSGAAQPLKLRLCGEMTSPPGHYC